MSKISLSNIAKIFRFDQYEKIYESKKTESEGISILTKRGIKNPDSAMMVIKDIDKSNNQKNIPLIASIWEDDPDIDLFKRIFSLYDDMVNRKRINPFSLVRGGGIKNEDREIPAENGILRLMEYLNSKNSTVTKSNKSGNLLTKDKPIFDKNGIKIYKVDSEDKCIMYTNGALNGKIYSFCIGARGIHNAYNAYRSRGSSIYFIIDNNRDDGDPLELVVYILMVNDEPLLTDSNNDSGYISEYGGDVHGYQEYLRSKGVDIDKLLVPIPLSKEESEDIEATKSTNTSIDWWKNLHYRTKLLYVTKHILTNDQFAYSLNDKDVMTRYASTVGEIPESQYVQMKPENKKSYIRSRARLLFVTDDLLDLDEYKLRKFEEREFIKSEDYFGKFINVYGNPDYDEIPFDNDKLMEIYIKEIQYINKKIYDKLNPHLKKEYLKKVADRINHGIKGATQFEDFDFIKENPVLVKSFNKKALDIFKPLLDLIQPIKKNMIDLLDKDKLEEIQKIGSLYNQDIKLGAYGGIQKFKESLKNKGHKNTDGKNDSYIIGIRDDLFNQFPNDVKDAYINYIKSEGDGNYYISPEQEGYVIGTRESGNTVIYRISKLPLTMMMLELGNSTVELIEEFKKTMGENYIIDRVIDYMKYGKIKKDDQYLYITKGQKEKLLSEDDCEKIRESGYFWGLDQKKAQELYTVHYTTGQDVQRTIGQAAQNYIYSAAGRYFDTGKTQEDKRVFITLSDSAFGELTDSNFDDNPEEKAYPCGKGYYLSLMTKLPSFGLTEYQEKVKNNYK